IEAAVSEADVGGVEEGQMVEFTVDAFPGRTFRGRVSQVRFEPVVSQNVVTYIAIVDVRNDDLKLRPGMTANASIITAQRQDVVRLPAASLRFRPPEGANVAGATNAIAAPSGGQTNSPTVRPQGGGGGEFSQMSPEERRRRFESMSPEERAQMRARFGGGRSGRGDSEGNATRTVYLAETNGVQTLLKPVTVKTGAGDGSWVEVLEGLKEGDVVATGIVQPATQTASQTAPAANPFSGGGRPRIR
ncbi:MAG: efflux RND transporter periplasmic adaptor subunit, partial [Limisphaerales bacterium]